MKFEIVNPACVCTSGTPKKNLFFPTSVSRKTYQKPEGPDTLWPNGPPDRTCDSYLSCPSGSSEKYGRELRKNDRHPGRRWRSHGRRWRWRLWFCCNRVYLSHSFPKQLFSHRLHEEGNRMTTKMRYKAVTSFVMFSLLLKHICHETWFLFVLIFLRFP